MKKEIGIVFILLAIFSLLGGLLFGTISAFNFIYPDFCRSVPFFKSRPLHVSLVVAWIFLSAIGGIYYYLPKYCTQTLFSDKLPRWHFGLFFVTGLIILLCYFFGKFGGREYWEFPAVLAIPMLISWILFGINFFKTVFKKEGHWPVYLWMWSTGIFFFFLTFMESYLWIFPYFRDNITRDLTVQWKSSGALVGSWNMMVYGTAFFVMERISGDTNIAKSKLTFSMYFLGLVNLMFGWAHHIYIVPSASWIKYIAYGISMTELIILGKIIWNWKNTLTDAKKNFHFLPFRFVIASDLWIFLNLILALGISIPAVNIFTHGTHITVAHAMGSTIGINTTILLASCYFLISDITKHEYSLFAKKIIKTGFWLFNFSLAIFWVSLIFAGSKKGMMVIENKLSFQEMMQRVSIYLIPFAVSGLGIFLGLLMILVPPIKVIYTYLRKNNQ